jgi:hypothetical protein
MRRLAFLVALAILAGGTAGCGKTRDAAPSGSGAPAEVADAAPSGAESAAGGTPGAAPGSADSGAPSPSPSFTSDENRREVMLFFQEKKSEFLAPEKRRIFLTASVADQAKQIVVEVINGPQDSGLLPTVPRETRVRGFYLDRFGTAYVDLSGEIVARHPGGTAEEIATIFSLVNSLTYNLPEIKRVHLLVDGEERDTLQHLDLRRDYRQDLSIVNMDGERSG